MKLVLMLYRVTHTASYWRILQAKEHSDLSPSILLFLSLFLFLLLAVFVAIEGKIAFFGCYVTLNVRERERRIIVNRC